MHKTVLIILAAVVALIVIVVLTGMRYLRADDEDDFDDEMAAERGQSSAPGDHMSRDHWRTRQHDDRREDAPRQRARGHRGREGMMVGGGGRDRGERDGFRPDAFAGVATGRGVGRDNVGRDDSVGAPHGRVADRGGTSRPGRDVVAMRDVVRTSDRRGVGRDTARDGGRRDIAVRGDDRGWDDAGFAGREDRSGRNSGSHRDGRPVDGGDIAGWDGPSRDSNGRDVAGRDTTAAGRDDRDRRGNTGPNARPDSRKTSSSQGRRDDSLPDVRPRAAKSSQGKSKRESDGDWPSTEWDELSDVDYWAELASDKPLTTSAQSATPPGRPERDRDRGAARSDTDSGPKRSERRDTADRRGFAAVPGEPADSGFATRTESYGATELRRAIAAGSEPARTPAPARTLGSGVNRMPQPVDDDPLTSPSFPRVAADDSRSYRRSRSESVSGSRQPETQTRPHSGRAVPHHPPVGPLDNRTGQSRSSGGYSVPATNVSATNGTGYPVSAGPADSYSQPASQVPEPYLLPAASAYPGDSGTAAYSTPMQPAPGYAAPLPAAPGYQGPDSASYPVPIASPPLPSQPMPSATGYNGGHDGGGHYAGGHRRDQAGYPGYAPGAGVTHSPAPQPQLSHYTYSQSAEPGFAGQLPAGQPVGGYGVYQPPAQTDMAGVYPVPGTQPAVMPPGGGMGSNFSQPGPHQVQPGYPTAPYNPAPYEPAGYPTRGYEADAALPADPYAADPYGYPGYGSARLARQRWHGRAS